MNALFELPGDKAVGAPTQGQANPSNRILFVDDSLAVREASATVLIYSGYHGDVAEDGEAINSNEQKGNANHEYHYTRELQTACAVHEMAGVIRAVAPLLLSVLADPVRPCGAGINCPGEHHRRRHGL